MRNGDARWLSCVVAALAVAVSLSAHQNTAAESDAEFVARLNEGQRLFAERDWDRSAAAFQALRVAAREKRAPLWEGRGSLGLSRIANERSKYDDARKFAAEALAIFERLTATGDIADANHSLGLAAESLGDADVAQTHYQRAVAAYLAAANAPGRMLASVRLLSITAADTGPLDGFDDLQREAHALGEKNIEGQILRIWGDLLYTRSIYQPAMEKLEAAAALFEETGSRADLGMTYYNLGRLYRAHGQTSTALEFQLKALKIHETLNTPRLLVLSLNAVAVVLEWLGDLEQSRVYFARGLAVAEASGVLAYINLMRANLGGLLVDSDIDVPRGLELMERANTPGTGFFALRLASLADAYVKVGRYQDALASARRALSACSTPTDCIEAYAADGRAQLASGHESEALADQNHILATVEKLRAALVPSDLLKQNFRTLWEQAYSIAIDLHFRRGEFREALETSELARSRAFIDLLASRSLHEAGQLTRETDATASGTLRSEAAAAPATVDTLTAITARLHSTLLAYWVTTSNVYIWVLKTDGTVHGATVTISRPKLDELVRSITRFTRPPESSPPATLIATRGNQQIALSGNSQRAWRALYDVLIRPVEHELPTTAGTRITIVPYGPLLGVPFAALRDGQGRYLIERYTIHSVPAAAVLEFTAAKVRDDARDGSVLLVGDPAAPPRVPGEPPLPRLSGASEEVRAIARLLPPARTTMLAGSAATEPRVRTSLDEKAVIHFATHGVVRDANPLTSFLALGAVADGSADGQLTTDEIYGLHLNATLVVLSACRSGGGLVTGDGIAGLARAFFYAGTPSVIVSVWDVADQPTNRLLPAFYRQWLKGSDKAAALRSAQLALIRSLRAGEVKVTLPVGTFVLPEDPAFWAAFVLLGEPD